MDSFRSRLIDELIHALQLLRILRDSASASIFPTVCTANQGPNSPSPSTDYAVTDTRFGEAMNQHMVASLHQLLVDLALLKKMDDELLGADHLGQLIADLAARKTEEHLRDMWDAN